MPRGREFDLLFSLFVTHFVCEHLPCHNNHQFRRHVGVVVGRHHAVEFRLLGHHDRFRVFGQVRRTWLVGCVP